MFESSQGQNSTHAYLIERSAAWRTAPHTAVGQTGRELQRPRSHSQTLFALLTDQTENRKTVKDPFQCFTQLQLHLGRELTCQAGSHLLWRLRQFGSFQRAVGVHILPPLQVLGHSVLDLLSPDPLHGLKSPQTTFGIFVFNPVNYKMMRDLRVSFCGRCLFTAAKPPTVPVAKYLPNQYLNS